MNPTDPETDLRTLWTSQGVTQERQNECIAQITAAAQPGAMVGPFRIGGPAPELFDTTDCSPLFAGVAVPATHADRPAPAPIRQQAAWCCTVCGGTGPFLTDHLGKALCYPCARIANRRK